MAITPQSVVDFLKSIAGRKTISGQFIECDAHDGPGGGLRPYAWPAIQAIHDSTGKWLGCLGVDFYHYNVPGPAVTDSIPRCIDYWNAGGLIVLTCHAPNPTTGGGCADVSNLDAAGLLTDGTATHNALVNMLDQWAAAIQQWKDAGVVVIFRPWHEGDGFWFWWGTGKFLSKAQSIALWQFTHDYLTNIKGLDNIVWAWTGTADMTNYPGDAFVDVVGVDIYTDTPNTGDLPVRYPAFQTVNKPFILGEFGFVSTGQDETKLINAIGSVAPNTVLWQQWWSGGDNAGMDVATNVAAALNDPRVLNRGDFTLEATAPAQPENVRDYWDLPGGQNSAWCLPFGDGAQWIRDGAEVADLRHGGYINPTDSFGCTIYTGQPTDSTYTFNGNGNTVLQSGYPGNTTWGTVTCTAHLPTGAVSPGHPGSTDDGPFVFFDPVSNPGKMFCFGQANIDPPGLQPGQGPFNAGQGEFDDALSDSFGEDQETGNFGSNAGAGVIRAYDLDPDRNPRRIPGTNLPAMTHALRYATDAMYLKRNDLNLAGDVLNPNAWPQKYQDGQSGINVYTGNLLAGRTVGIPMDVPEPAGLTDGGKILWWTMQHYPSFWRDQAGGGFHLRADQEAWSQFPDLVNGMNTDLPTIVQHLCILSNQHQGGQDFAQYPKNGPGNRVDTGPVPLRGTTPVTPPDTGHTYSAVLTRTTGGSVTDSSGGVWTLTSDGRVQKNGTDIPGGAGTAQFVLVDDDPEAQDANTGQWYHWTGSMWESIAAPDLPPPPTNPPPTDLYVSATGSDTADGSSATPFATIAHAASVAGSGTTVHVASGTYLGDVLTPTDGVVYRSEPAGAVVIVGDGTTQYAWHNTGANVTIDGFDVSGPTCRLGIYAEGAGAVVQNCVVHDVLTDPTTFTNATQSGMGGAGIELEATATGGAVKGNTVSRLGPPGKLSGLLAGIYMIAQNSTCERNLVHDISGVGIQAWHSAAHISFTHNTIDRTTSGGFYLGSGDSGATAETGDYFTVSDNIVSNAVFAIHEGGTTGTHNVYANNLVFQSGATPIVLQHGLTATGTVEGDPKYVDATHGDYRVYANSPAVRAGTDGATIGAFANTVTPPTDFDFAASAAAIGQAVTVVEGMQTDLATLKTTLEGLKADLEAAG